MLCARILSTCTLAIRSLISTEWLFIAECNWNLEMLIFVEGGKLEDPEKNPHGKGEPTNNATHVEYLRRGSNL
jgi:hypothetical protein